MPERLTPEARKLFLDAHGDQSLIDAMDAAADDPTLGGRFVGTPSPMTITEEGKQHWRNMGCTEEEIQHMIDVLAGPNSLYAFRQRKEAAKLEAERAAARERMQRHRLVRGYVAGPDVEQLEWERQQSQKRQRRYRAGEGDPARQAELREADRLRKQRRRAELRGAQYNAPGDPAHPVGQPRAAIGGETNAAKQPSTTQEPDAAAARSD
jgi:hypothetical protein